MQNFQYEWFYLYISITGMLFLVACIISEWGKLYDKTKWIDLVLHGLSAGLIFTPAGFWLAYNLTKSPLWLASLFAFSFSMMVISIWEVIEFTIDSIFKTNMQRWKSKTKDKDQRGNGLLDSMWDIIATLIGTTITCILLLTLAFVL